MYKKEFELSLGDKRITAIFTDMANQTNGSVIIKSGETAVLATAVMGKSDRKDIDYFPLVVDYEEKFYAAGLVLGGRFMKREGRPSEEAILSGRLVDRTIRPLFNHKMRRDVQIVITVLSIDEDNDPDVLAILAASLALGTSDIPWNGPVGAVRLGYTKTKDGAFIINPTYRGREEGDLDIVVCGKDRFVNMIEAEAREVQEDVVKKALSEASEHIEALISFQKNIITEVGRPKISAPVTETPQDIINLFDSAVGEEKLTETLFASKNSREVIRTVSDDFKQAVLETLGESSVEAALHHLHERIDHIVHKEAFAGGRRPDGRLFDEVRPLYAQAGGISTVTHGSGLFYRGDTHVLTMLTLGGPQDSLLIEGMEVRTKKYFMHHYNFPPFSTGEVGRMGGANRRAVGHGALAEKALRAVVPDKETFPYTIRLVSESLSSNGSTSMASVCAGSLALMDGGIPILRPVAGIAMGLMLDSAARTKKEPRYKILTDIQGPEDHHGDMDFKVAGTEEGITALQMDVKLEGVRPHILEEALEKARTARLHILSVITEAIPAPRPDLKNSAPRVAVIKIDPEKIGLLIGPGGKTVKKISDETQATIEIDQGGAVFVTGGKEAVAASKQQIEALTREYKEGDMLSGVVSKIFDFGAVVEVGPGADGLVHISELAPHRVEKVTDVVCPGEKVPVMVKGVDERGRLSLSIAKANPNYAQERGKKQCDVVPENTRVGYNKSYERRGPQGRGRRSRAV